MPVPSVIRLTHFVQVPFRARAALNRRAVFARDDHRCQYCGDTGREHRPRGPPQPGRPARLGERGRRPAGRATAARRTGWSTRSASCSGAGPTAPKELTWIIVAVGTIDPRWEPYLQAGAALSA